jgi:hypothetical protein
MFCALMTSPPASRRARSSAARRCALASLICWVAVCALAAAPGLAARGAVAKPKHATRPALNLYATRALLAYRAMQQAFYVPGTGLYRGEPQYSFLWPFSQALAATVSLSYLQRSPLRLAPARSQLIGGLGHYLGPPLPAAAGTESSAADEAAAARETTVANQATGTGATSGAANVPVSPTAPALRSYDGNVAPPIGPGGDSYYDDNEWVGIELARLYRLDHDPEILQQAEQIMQFVMAGWETVGPAGQPLPCPGGVPFSNAKSNVSRNTVTDAPAAELAVQLYRITREALYLQFAEQAYAWVRRCLLEPNGLYADHINLNGTVQRTLWSYNQGSMMGAGVLLYQATHDGAYLYQARQTAKAAEVYFPYTRLSNENPFFAAVYFRNLIYLDYVTHDPPGTLPAREYAFYAWARHRLVDNLFVYGSPPTSELLRQAALVQVYALLATSPSTYF